MAAIGAFIGAAVRLQHGGAPKPVAWLLRQRCRLAVEWLNLQDGVCTDSQSLIIAMDGLQTLPRQKAATRTGRGCSCSLIGTSLATRSAPAGVTRWPNLVSCCSSNFSWLIEPCGWSRAARQEANCVLSMSSKQLLLKLLQAWSRPRLAKHEVNTTQDGQVRGGWGLRPNAAWKNHVLQ